MDDKMAAMDNSFSREKRVLLDEIVSLKRRIELLDLEGGGSGMGEDLAVCLFFYEF